MGQLKAGLTSLGPHPRARASGHECPDISYYMGDLIINKNDATALLTAEQEAYVCLNYAPPLTLKDTEPVVRATSYSALAGGEHETKLALGALKDLVRRMGSMPGQRVIVMISPGFLALADQLQDETDVIDRAIKAGVTISALDARGLYTDAPDITKRAVPAAAAIEKQRYGNCRRPSEFRRDGRACRWHRWHVLREQ